MPLEASDNYKDLRSEVDRLSKQFLEPFSVYDARYKKRHESAVAAFRVSLAAGIEFYLEIQCELLSTEAIKSWKRSGYRYASPTLVSLVAFSANQRSTPAEHLVDPKNDLEAHIAAVNKTLSIYRRKANHGIVEKNLCRLLLPVGFLQSDIDPIWLTLIDQFGKTRGDVAHKPRYKYSATHVVDVSLVKADVREIMRGLLSIDRLFTKFLNNLH